MPLQRMTDRLVFLLVDLFVLVVYPREVIRLFKRNTRRGTNTWSISAPRVTNAKYSWRKLFDHDPRFNTVTDKLTVKRFVDELGIAVTVPKTLWQGNPQELPPHFYKADVVIKASHGWGTNIYPGRDHLDRAETDRLIKEAMSQNHGRRTNQWAYYNLKPCLFVEERIVSSGPFVDLKIYSYGAQLRRIVQIRSFGNGKRLGGIWNRHESGQFVLSKKPSSVSPEEIDTQPLPATLDRALEISEQIGEHFDHMRIDFLAVDDRLYLGELTVYNLSGRENEGHRVDADSNRHWDLRRSWFLTTPQTGWHAIYARALKRFCDRQSKKTPALNRAGPVNAEQLQKGLAIARTLNTSIASRPEQTG